MDPIEKEEEEGQRGEGSAVRGTRRAGDENSVVPKVNGVKDATVETGRSHETLKEGDFRSILRKTGTNIYIESECDKNPKENLETKLASVPMNTIRNASIPDVKVIKNAPPSRGPINSSIRGPPSRDTPPPRITDVFVHPSKDHESKVSTSTRNVDHVPPPSTRGPPPSRSTLNIVPTRDIPTSRIPPPSRSFDHPGVHGNIPSSTRVPPPINNGPPPTRDTSVIGSREKLEGIFVAPPSGLSRNQPSLPIPPSRDTKPPRMPPPTPRDIQKTQKISNENQIEAIPPQLTIEESEYYQQNYNGIEDYNPRHSDLYIKDSSYVPPERIIAFEDTPKILSEESGSFANRIPPKRTTEDYLTGKVIANDEELVTQQQIFLRQPKTEGDLISKTKSALRKTTKKIKTNFNL